MNNTYVPHPGEILASHLRKLNMTQVDFAWIIDRNVVRVNEIIRGKTGISARSAKEFAAALGTTARYWMDAQIAYDLSRATNDTSEITKRAKEREKR